MVKNNKSNLFSVRSMVFIAVFAAIICIASPFSIPLPGLIPISLATFAIYLTGAMLGWKRGMFATLVYILIGTVGLPVFTGFSGGFAKLFGVTGGYIIGYIPLVILTGLFADKFADKKRLAPVGMIVGMILGTAALYTFGTIWYMIYTGANIVSALMGCVVPFLIGDMIKIVCSTLIAVPLKSRLADIINNV